MYVYTVANPLEGEMIPLAIFHHIDVDPKKIVMQFMNMPDACEDNKDVLNALNHRDWCKWMMRYGYSSDKE